MKTIIDKERCCGCEACRQICPMKCIEMKEDEEGFMYPFIQEEVCINCDRCIRVCPVLKI